MSDQAILSALGVVLPAGTTIAPGSVFLRQGIGPDTAAWPALTLNIPVSDDEEFVVGPTFQTVHTCHALYLDRWESGTRTYEQIMADAAAQLTIMRDNLRANRTLVVDGVPACWEIRRIQRRMVGPLDRGQLGFPAIQAEMLVWIVDFPETLRTFRFEHQEVRGRMARIRFNGTELANPPADSYWAPGEERDIDDPENVERLLRNPVFTQVTQTRAHAPAPAEKPHTAPKHGPAEGR